MSTVKQLADSANCAMKQNRRIKNFHLPSIRASFLVGSALDSGVQGEADRFSRT